MSNKRLPNAEDLATFVAEMSLKYIFERSLSPEHAAILREYEEDGGDIVPLVGTIGDGELLAEFRDRYPTPPLIATTPTPLLEVKQLSMGVSVALAVAVLARQDFVLYGVPITPEEADMMSSKGYHQDKGYQSEKKEKLGQFREACRHSDVMAMLVANPGYFVLFDRGVFAALNQNRRDDVHLRLT